MAKAKLPAILKSAISAILGAISFLRMFSNHLDCYCLHFPLPLTSVNGQVCAEAVGFSHIHLELKQIV
ncbi:MAG: hypothetical protein WCX14_04970 [Dysgonamonadaceae bacterium]